LFFKLYGNARVVAKPQMRAVAVLFVSVVAWSCSAQEQSNVKDSIKESSLPNSVVLIAVGDIAVCGEQGDEQTAALTDSLLRADSAANIETAVITMGDNAYPSGDQGSRFTFQRCFAPAWGAKRIMNVIHPSPGNHDFEASAGQGYYAYFGDKAGPAGKGYYSFDIGKWHIVSLNSELLFDRAMLPEVREQEQWLKDDLKKNDKKCTLAYWHRPLFSSGWHGPTHEALGLWNILYDNGADLIINGHEHHYERFAAMTPAGVADSVKGMVEIMAGTGGGNLRAVRRPLAPGSAQNLTGYFGVLKLTLGDGEYRHAFVDTSGRVWDAGGGKCH
jgi:hypothetical protein